MTMFSRPLNLTDTPPSEKRVPELIRVPADDVLRGIVCCDQVWELATHWHQGRTRPCTAANGHCELCGVAPDRWYGLLCLYRPREQRYVWVQLTADAVTTLLLAMREGVELLGAEVTIGRERKTLRAPVWIKFDPYKTKPERLPKPQTPHETLQRVFTDRNGSRKRTAS